MNPGYDVISFFYHKANGKSKYNSGLLPSLFTRCPLYRGRFNQPEIGKWDPAKVPLVDNSDGSWRGTFAIKENKQLEFKITRGSWDSEAASNDGKIHPNCVTNVQSDTTLTINIENWKDLVK